MLLTVIPLRPPSKNVGLDNCRSPWLQLQECHRFSLSFLSCGQRDHQGGRARGGPELTSETGSFLECFREDVVLAISKCLVMAVH